MFHNPYEMFVTSHCTFPHPHSRLLRQEAKSATTTTTTNKQIVENIKKATQENAKQNVSEI